MHSRSCRTETGRAPAHQTEKRSARTEEYPIYQKTAACGNERQRLSEDQNAARHRAGSRAGGRRTKRRRSILPPLAMTAFLLFMGMGAAMLFHSTDSALPAADVISGREEMSGDVFQPPVVPTVLPTELPSSSVLTGEGQVISEPAADLERTAAENPDSEPMSPESLPISPAVNVMEEYGYVPESAPVDMEEWFQDAVFIGDSRTDGLRLYSGIKQGKFLTYNGITTYDIMSDKKVIREGEEKLSVLDALARKQYKKVYLNLGINELGYHSPKSFQKVYGDLVTAVQERQPGAHIYIQTIIPVNTALCLTHQIPSYVTNEAIAAHNQVLMELSEERQLSLINVSAALTDESGEVPAEYSSDGVHFKKVGYEKWLGYLLTHTGTADL